MARPTRTALMTATSILVAGMAFAQPAAAHPGHGSGRVSDGATDSARNTHEHQHGESTGHLPPRRNGVELVGKAPVENKAPGRVADVTVKGNYAYLAAFSDPDCTAGGTYVMDIKDLRKPKQVGFIPTGPGSFVGEGQQVASLRTRYFRGDVLLFNNEICGEVVEGTLGGATMVDVSDPLHPVVLAAGFGDLDPEGAGPGIAHQVHSARIWTDRGKAYAVLVDDEETADVDVFDITDPRRPIKIAEYDVAAQFPQVLQEGLGLDEVFFHDVVVRQVGRKQIMLLSYWDAGQVLLDVTDPLRPAYVADTDFANPDPELLAQSGRRELPEGNAHQAEWTKDGRYIVGTDEDFDPTGLDGATDDGTTFSSSQGSDTRQLGPGDTLTGTAVYAGRACDADAAVPAPPAGGGPYLAVVERGVCTFTEKITNVEEVTANGGYAGTVVINREGADGCGSFGMTVEGGRPAVSVDRRTGFSFFDIEGQYSEEACRAGDGTATAPITLGTTGDKITARAFFNGWGYIHLYRNGTGKLAELDTYAIPEAMDPRFAGDFGALSVHEVATSQRRSDLIYSSYYAGGLRVLRIEKGKLREVGAFIDQGGNDFWGVEVFRRGGKEYVAASDRDYGLYIFRYTGRS